jgi:hypothetical protein
LFLAHNNSTKTGRNSELYVLDRYNHKVLDIQITSYLNAHNVTVVDENIYICNSMKGSLFCNDLEIFRYDKYLTRGLSITEDYLVVGGSQMSDRAGRSSTDGAIFILDRTGKSVSDITMKRVGGVHEIRHIGKDYAMSEN